jgi:hypothetical protein
VHAKCVRVISQGRFPNLLSTHFNLSASRIESGQHTTKLIRIKKEEQS